MKSRAAAPLPPAPAPLRLLVVEDHLIARTGLLTLLHATADLVVVAEAASAEEAVAAHAAHAPDVTLMDLRLAGGSDGVSAIARIRERSPAARVVALTTYDGDEDILRAVRAGAAAYLLKDVDAAELTRVIRAVAAGESCLPPAVAARLAARLARPDLSARELEVLTAIVAGRANKEIGAELFIAEHTVKNHVKSILAKLGVADRTQAATAALARGLVRRGRR